MSHRLTSRVLPLVLLALGLLPGRAFAQGADMRFNTIKITSTGAGAVCIGNAVGATTCTGGAKLGTMDIGHDLDTTITRVSAGVIAVEGATVATGGSSPTFAALTVTTLNAFTFNQSVASGASPTFGAGNVTGVLEANITDGTLLARLAAAETVTGVYDFANGLKIGTGATITSSSNVALLNAANVFPAAQTATRLIASTGGYSNVDGALSHEATSGLVLQAKAGTTFDFSFLNAGGTNAIMRVPTGTINVTFTGLTTAPKVLTGASGWNVLSAGDGTDGAYFGTNVGFTNLSTINYVAMRMLGDGTTPFQIQTSPATAVGVARTWTTRFGVSTGGNWLYGANIMDSVGTPSCTTSCTAVVGKDYAFRITKGGGQTGIVQQVITFGNTWTNAPICVTTAQDSGGSAYSYLITAVTTTSLTLDLNVSGGPVDGTYIYVHCRGY